MVKIIMVENAPRKTMKIKTHGATENENGVVKQKRRNTTAVQIQVIICFKFNGR